MYAQPPPSPTAARIGFQPRELHSMEDTGLTLQFLADLTLKVVYFASTMTGYDLALTSAVAEAVGVPVIASGGAGELEHLAQALHAGADAALAASIFHFGRYSIAEAKEHLAAAGLPVRRAVSA